MRREKSKIGSVLSRIISHGLAFAVSMAAVDGTVSLIEANAPISDRTEDFEQLDFIPDISGDQCLYVSPDSRLQLSFTARKGTFFSSLYNLALPEWMEIEAGRVEIVLGTLPAFVRVHCAVVDREKVNVIDSFEQAAAIVAPDVLAMSARLHELMDEYTFAEKLEKSTVHYPGRGIQP